MASDKANLKQAESTT